MLMLEELSILKTSKLFPSQALEPCKAGTETHEQKTWKGKNTKSQSSTGILSLDLLVLDSFQCLGKE